MKRNIIIIIIFTIGIGIFLYPVVSNWFNSRTHYTIVSDYDESVSRLDPQEIENMRLTAQDYNVNLASFPIRTSDPFDENDETTGHTGYYNILNIGESMGYVEIPSIDVKLPIYHGTDDDVLSQGVGHMSNTSLPVGGLGTHSVLTGHRGLPSARMFRDLGEMGEGELFFIKTLDETLAYEVYDVQIVEPHETEWLVIDPEEDLATLITCDPYMINTHRMLVMGERVPYESPADEIEFAAEEEVAKGSFAPWYIGAAVLLILIAGFVLYRRRKSRISFTEEGGST